MLQEDVDDYLASLTAGEYGESGARHNTLLAYRNDLGQICNYLEQQEVESWRQVNCEHIVAVFVRYAYA